MANMFTKKGFVPLPNVLKWLLKNGGPTNYLLYNWDGSSFSTPLSCTKTAGNLGSQVMEEVSGGDGIISFARFRHLGAKFEHIQGHRLRFGKRP